MQTTETRLSAAIGSRETPKISSTVRNGIWSVLDVLVYPLVMVVATPYFLHALGERQFGLWAAINAVVAALGMVNIGGPDSIIRFISRYRSSGDPESVRRVSSITFTVYLGIVALLIPIGAFLPDVVARLHLIAVGAAEGRILSGALMWAVWLFALRLMEQVFLAVPKGYEEFGIASAFSMFSKVGLVGVQILVVYLHGGLDSVFRTASLFFCAIAAVEFIWLERIFPDCRFRIATDFTGSRDIIAFGFWSWMYAVLGMISTQLDRLIVGARVSLEVLAVYSIGVLVSTQLHAVFAAAVGWIFPRVSALAAQGRDLRPLYYLLQKGVISAGLWVLSVFYLFRVSIFGTWLGGTWPRAEYYIVLFLFFTSVELATIVPYYFFRSEHIVISTYFKFGNMITNVVGMTAGFYFWGVAGIVFGKFASSIIVSSMNRWVLHRRCFAGERGWRGIQVTLPSLLWIALCLALDRTPQWVQVSFLLAALVFMTFRALCFFKPGLCRRVQETAADGS